MSYVINRDLESPQYSKQVKNNEWQQFKTIESYLHRPSRDIQPFVFIILEKELTFHTLVLLC